MSLGSMIPIRGAELFVVDEGAGPAIVFVHGMCGDADVWTDQAGRFSNDHRCVRYDRRGHTRSSLGEGVERTVELHADDAASLIDKLGLAPALLVGSSGGARIGIDVARRYPDLLRGAVLSEPALIALADDSGASFMASVRPAVEAATTPQSAVDAFFGVVDPELWATAPEERKRAYRANHVELLGDLLMPRYAPSADELAAIHVPIRFLLGERSLPVFGQIVRRLAAEIPGAELLEVPGASHATYATNPDAFESAVRSFPPTG
jgi:3-oxoadipate enol-lactonase